MDDLSRFCCLNSDCPEHGKRGAGNLTVTHRYGPDKVRRMLRCRACKARFSERKGTPAVRLAPAPGQGRLGPPPHRRGRGVRKTGRLVGVEQEHRHPLRPAAGAHAGGLHDELVAFSPSDPRGPVR